METSTPIKSGKMILNEIGVKQKVLPTWETVQETKDLRSPPQFRSVCRYPRRTGELEGTATGGTKKEAEQKAAEEVLAKLFSLSELDHVAMSDLQKLDGFQLQGRFPTAAVGGNFGGSSGIDNEPVSDTDDDTRGNPIGELQMICQKFKMPLPKYTEEDAKRGPNNTNVFKVSCSVNIGTLTVAESVRRIKKQQAKKIASLRVLRKLNNQGYSLTGGPSLVKSPGSPSLLQQKSLSPNKLVGSITVKTEVVSTRSSQNNEEIDENSAIKRALLSILEQSQSKSAKSMSGSTNDNSKFNCILQKVEVEAGTLSELSSSISSSFPKRVANEDDEVIEYFKKLCKITTDGNPIELFDKSAALHKLKYHFYPMVPLKDGLTVCVFLSLTFPATADISKIFNKTHVVHGEGTDIEYARKDAAIKALAFLRNMLYNNNDPTLSLNNFRNVS